MANEMASTAADEHDASTEDHARSLHERGKHAHLARFLFESYHPMVFRVVLRICGNRDEAEDLTQEVFVRVIRGLKRFRGASRYSTWIYRIAVNTALKAGKRAVRREIPDDDMESLAGAAPAEDEDQSEAGRLIHAALATLPDRYRVPLILRELESRSRTEIQGILGLGQEALKSRLQRGRRMLEMRVRELQEGAGS